jgi:hypothetical protein
MMNNESRAGTKTKVANEMKTFLKNKRRSSKAKALLEKGNQWRNADKTRNNKAYRERNKKDVGEGVG